MSETEPYQFDVFTYNLFKAARVLICCANQMHFSIIVPTNKQPLHVLQPLKCSQKHCNFFYSIFIETFYQCISLYYHCR